MKKIILLLACLAVLTEVKAQQDAMFTHYMYNTLWLNPAYAGSRDALTLTGIHRSQWVNFDGAPNSQSFTMHAPLLNGKAGGGLSVLNDAIGVTKSTLVALDFAYRVKLTEKSKLAFGLKGLANFYRNELSKLQLDQQSDIAFAQNNNRILPNAGAGIYYSHERFYLGVSTPRLLENKLGDASSVNSKEQRHYFLILGSVFNLTKTLKLKPTAFVKATAGAPLEGDITGTFIFNNKFNLGAAYRTGDAASILLGYNFTEQFYLGYSFDWSTANTTGKYNSGSHEIMLRYDLIFRNNAKIKSPRYF
jgi:type IX secretion system PorP/SprF family membrane protein